MAVVAACRSDDIYHQVCSSLCWPAGMLAASQCSGQAASQLRTTGGAGSYHEHAPSLVVQLLLSASFC